MTVTLYQFPISHYCEKVRFALDYKGIDYKVENLLPGLHHKTTLKLTPQSSVPVLQHGDKTIHDSSAILTYLDEAFPEQALTPKAPEQATAVKEWERYLDQEVGVPLRCVAYHTLLDHPKVVSGFFTKDGPFWGPLFIKAVFPKLQKKMRQFMNINADSAERSLATLKVALERLDDATSGKEFLVGDQFTRADLTAAALLAPFFMPAQYGLDWPADFPEPLDQIVDELRPKLSWAEKVYHAHR